MQRYVEPVTRGGVRPILSVTPLYSLLLEKNVSVLLHNKGFPNRDSTCLFIAPFLLV
jgi:hypothetical protein